MLRGLWVLTWLETKIFIREPLGVVGTIGFLGLFSYDDHTSLAGGPLSSKVADETWAAATHWHTKLFDVLLVLIGLHVFAAISYLVWKRENLIRAMMEKQLTLPDAVWSRLNLSWAGFFLAMGVINLFVAYRFSEDTWVNFKLFGGIGLMVLFVFAQGLYLSRFLEADAPAGNEDGK